jgi:hypothetical protein
LYSRWGGVQAALWAILVPSILRVVLHFWIADLELDKNLTGLETLIPPMVSLILYMSIAAFTKPAETKPEMA